MSKQIPEIRFKEFTDEWEQRKFKEFSKKTGKKNSKGLDFPAYSVSNKVGLIAQNDQFDGSRLNNMEKTSYKFVEPNEFTYNPARINVGSIAFNNMNKTVIVSSLYVVVRMSEALNNEFIFQYLKSPIFIKEVRRNTEGSVREYLFYENFSNIKLPYTKNTNEQNKIGTFFKSLDDAITLHLAAIQRQQDLKKAMLQKLFPVNGSTIPTVRFASFSEEWEQRKFEEIVDVRSGRDYKHLYNGDIPVYGTGGYMLSVDKALSYDEDAIGIGRKGTIDKPYLLKAPFWTVDTLFYSVPIKENNLFFINNLFQRVNWKRYDESTGVPSLSKAVINKISAMIPELDEQAKIGKFFKKLDETIALHQQALEKLKLLKQSLLQKMFVN